MRSAIVFAAFMLLARSALATVDRLDTVYQPLHDPQEDRIRIVAVPFFTCYAEPEAWVSAVSAPNVVLHAPEELGRDLNLTSLYGIKVRCLQADVRGVVVELDLTNLARPEGYEHEDKEVVGATVACIELTLKHLKNYEGMTLEVRCREDDARLDWQAYDRPYHWGTQAPDK